MRVVKSLKVCNLMDSFCPKHIKIYMKKIQNSYVWWRSRAMQSLKKNWLLVPEMIWGIWWILMRAVASLKICTLICYFCCKCIMFESKKYRGVMCHNTEEWWKIWGGTDLCFEKWHEEFGECRLILMRAVATLKICTLMGLFCSKYVKF